MPMIGNVENKGFVKRGGKMRLKKLAERKPKGAFRVAKCHSCPS
jgi:hypothetical protein